ncbi:PREDICTED: BAG family molecular chaperone regulator 1 isoform X2 [Tarenaya hassleriana]|uniref:BAG family molecular chaperone regulator 1 isoform X2 n=1 Tax=Tarenaya hassleriana TaxID=28532 RepID=UPI00053C199E|nr:PREDICTED: BAG family molecular chaperone regulator 1 isoform X2 [Tarenaya hassleriana]
MLKMRSKPSTLSPAMVPGGAGGDSGGNDWEMRPGGMLVQKRNPDSDRVGAPPPPIRVRIKYGSVYHEIKISPQATFGELKKMLSGPTGLHHQDQKIMYKDKERDSKSFLDVAGVKDRSKMVLMEDPISQEKRWMESRKKAREEKASKAISDISLEVDRLSGQVSAMESAIEKGGRVEEKDLVNLIELLMNELLKLDGIVADGDVKLQRKMQRYVETLDVLKVKNSTNDGERRKTDGPIQETRRETVVCEPIESLIDMPMYGNKKRGIQEQDSYHHHQQPRNSGLEPRNWGLEPFLVTTKWETFEATPKTSSTLSTTDDAIPSRFKWEFFD